VLDEARKSFEDTNRTVYEGPLLAEPTDTQQQAREDILGVADQSRGVGEDVVQLGQRTAQGEFLDPRSNPAFTDAVQSAIRPAREELTENVLPQLEARAIDHGAFGGDRHQVAEADAVQDFSREALDTASQMAYQTYEDERRRQAQAPELISSGLNLELFGPQMARRVGQVQRGDTQAEIDEQLRRFQMEQQAPWIGLPQYADIAMGAPTTTSTTQQTIPSQSQDIGNYIQAGLGALDTAAQVENQTGWISDAVGAVGDLFL
jgi:hypothetical protein